METGTLDSWPLVRKQKLSRDSRWKPAVWKVSGPTAEVSVKNFLLLKEIRSLPKSRKWMARWLLRREQKILRQLSGVAGVPALVGPDQSDFFYCSWLEGEPLNRELFQQRPQELADQLRRCIRELHNHGVYHLDLRQRQNILIHNGRRLFLVDFGAAVHLPAWIRWLLGGFFAWIDRQAVLKYLARYTPELLTAEEAKSLIRGQRLRRLWVVSKHRPRGEVAAALDRLRKSA